ncbi:MAG TPA: rhomboid family intramembrane serine protease [Gemmatimonadales bacterium]|nr:rhomboid family intramembrane serine protease [Gemmatimonadales bacterium]
MISGGPEPEERGEEPIVITPDMLVQRASPARARTVKAADSRIDFERGMRRIPPVIVLIIAVNIAVFAWEIASGVFVTSKEMIEAGLRGASLIDAGALVQAKVFAGEWWRMVTAMFLHGGFDHIIGNMIVLYIVGMAAEHAFGSTRMLLVYFAGGLAGSALSVLASPGPSVGASGAVFGVLSAVVVTLYRHQKHFYVRDKRIGIVLAAWAGYQLLTGFLTPFVDNFAHLGGILGGALAAMVLDTRLAVGR